MIPQAVRESRLTRQMQQRFVRVRRIDATEDQDETDRYWNAIVGGGEESVCGWCKDRWGLSWRIIPKRLLEFEKQGGEVGRRAFEAMMSMKKIDIAALERAVAGAGD